MDIQANNPPAARARSIPETCSNTSDVLAALAIIHSGWRTHKFIQTDVSPKGMGFWYRSPAATPDHQLWEGVCGAMCICWISNHAFGKNNWRWLANELSVIYPYAAHLILSLQASYNGVDEPWFGHIYHQAKTYGQWEELAFGHFGIQPYFDINSEKYRYRVKNDKPAGIISLTDITDNLFQGQGQGHYYYLVFGDRAHSHAICLWFDEDVTLFDPNFGEFWFERKSDFLKWFPTYWLVSYRQSYQPDFFDMSKWQKKTNR